MVMITTAGHLDEYDGPRPEDITIAVIGFTGHGKTSFIHHLTNSSGEGVEKVTPSNIKPSETTRAYRLYGHSEYKDRLVFIDTHGFEADSKDRSLGRVVNGLKKWCKAYQTQKVSGMLYTCSFNKQFNSTASKYPYNVTPRSSDFKSLKALCYTPSNLQFMKWCWEGYSEPLDPNLHSDRYFESLRQRTPGAAYVDFDGTQKSAWDIVDGIANQHLEGNDPAKPPLWSRFFRKLFCCIDAGPHKDIDSEENPAISHRAATPLQLKGESERGRQQPRAFVNRSQTPSIAGTGSLNGCAY